MVTIRVESRNAEGRVVSILEKDFAYTNKRILGNWLMGELETALAYSQTVTIKKVDSE